MAALSGTETPPIAGYGVALGNGWVDVWLSGRDGIPPLGGSMGIAMAREMARTILDMTKEEGGTDG